MLKRAAVSLDAFLWGESVVGREGEIVAAIKAQRSELIDLPTKYLVLCVLFKIILFIIIGCSWRMLLEHQLGC